MQRIIVPLSISPEQLQRWYQGSVKNVQARAHDGRRVRFPVSVLRPFVGHDGIQGQYVLEFDESNRFHRLLKIG